MAKTFVRILAIIFGITAIVLTIISFTYAPGTGQPVLILFSITMMINGVNNIAEGYAKSSEQKLVKVLKIILGIVIIIIAFIVFFGALANVPETLVFIYYVFSIAVMIVGIDRIIGGIIAKDERTGYRYGQAILGLFFIVCGIIIFVYYHIGLPVAILFIQISLIINGIIMIYYGATGQSQEYRAKVL